MEKRPVGLGIVGCGRVSMTRHLPALAKMRGIRVEAVADADSDRAQAAARKFRIPRFYRSAGELLQDANVEAVAVCVPASFHMEIALAALESNKHLFVEKPLALTSADCARLIEKTRNHDKVFLVGFNLRWHRLVRQTRQILERGGLGICKLLNSLYTSGSRNDPSVVQWRLKRETGGGVLTEQAIHHFDLWRFLLQDEVAEVFTMALNDDETATVTARMTRGTLVAATFSESTAHDNEMVFFGSKGRLRLSIYRFDGLDLLPAQGHTGDIGVRIRKALTLARQAPAMAKSLLNGGDYIGSYAQEWHHFLDCIERKASPIATVEDGLRSVQILEAILKSASAGRPVTLESSTMMPG